MIDYFEQLRLQFGWTSINIYIKLFHPRNRGMDLYLQSSDSRHWRKVKKNNKVSRHELLTRIPVFLVSQKYAKLQMYKAANTLFSCRLYKSGLNKGCLKRPGSTALNNDQVPKNISIW